MCGGHLYGVVREARATACSSRGTGMPQPCAERRSITGGRLHGQMEVAIRFCSNKLRCAQAKRNKGKAPGGEGRLYRGLE